MLECVQGEGGVKPLDFEYLRQVRRLCTEKDVLLVVDEVQTGVGRTGRFLACEHAGIRPDVVTPGQRGWAVACHRGLPVYGGTGRRYERWYARLHLRRQPGGVRRRPGGAVPGNGPRFSGGGGPQGRPGSGSRLEKMPGVRSVRGLGLMLGVELDGISGREAAEKCVSAGLLVLTAKSLMRLLPPLTITDEELDRGLSILEKVLTDCGGKEE